MHFIDQVNETLPNLLSRLSDDLERAIQMGYVQIDA
jgi:hypothetical protein